MSGESRRAVVVGGGIIGTTCAYYLARGGWQVTLLERGTLGSGSSSGNCGLICTSHILPLAEPGMVGQAIKALLRPNSPLAIKPRFDPALWAWLIRFARRCNEYDMEESARGIQPLLESSRALYPDLVKRESLDCEWEERGVLFAYRSRTEFEAFGATDRLLGESFHCPAQRLVGDEVLALEPALREGLAGGWYYKDDAQVRPDRLLSAWRRVLGSLGVEIREYSPFEGFRADGGHASAVVAKGAEIEAEAFVVATGSWTPLLDQHLGCRVPIQPGKGYSITMPRPATCPVIPMIFPETRVGVTPFHTGYRLGSTMEFAGYDPSISPSRLELLRSGSRPYLREPYCEPVEQEWYGWRPMTYDSLPIIDRSPALENVMIAAGHNMLGMSMAPATGKLVAELLGEEPPHLDPKPYRLDRYGARRQSASSPTVV
jgi:D-amino-acid dehydrogenase